MRYIKLRKTEPKFYDARAQKHRRIASHRTKRCGTCTFEFPEEDMTIEDGQERCPMCMDLYTAQYLADEQNDVADVKAESALRLNNPTQFSIRALQESRPAAVTSITDSSGNLLTQTSPLRLVRTVATTVLINGQYFTAAAVTTYDTGISDNTAPVITPTLITLSLIAAIGTVTGPHGITMSDGVTTYSHLYPRIIMVV